MRVKELYEELAKEVVNYIIIPTNDVKIEQKYDTEYYVSIEFVIDDIEFKWLITDGRVICMNHDIPLTDEQKWAIVGRITNIIKNDPKELEKLDCFMKLRDLK